MQTCQHPHLKRVSRSRLKMSKATATCLMLIVEKAEMERKGSITEKNYLQRGKFYIYLVILKLLKAKNHP